MSEKYLPPEIPTVYRGGNSLKCQSHDVKVDKETGNLKTTHGISVDADPAAVVKFGGAYLVTPIPIELDVIQRGKRATHFEIVPTSPISMHWFPARRHRSNPLLHQVPRNRVEVRYVYHPI